MNQGPRCVLLMRKKKRRWKISRYCPFNGLIVRFRCLRKALIWFPSIIRVFAQHYQSLGGDHQGFSMILLELRKSITRTLV
jgi:hypothetical protein